MAYCALILSALTYHAGTDTDYNEVNSGIGVQCDQSPIGSVSLGVYRNSLNGTSAYAGKRWGDTAYIEAGGVTGYDISPVSPYIRVGLRTRFAEFFVAPWVDEIKGDKEIKALFGMQLRFAF